MASYETAPDKQSYIFQGYQLPYNELAKTVQAKTQYWEYGASQLKNAYQQAAGLDLSLDQNRQALGDFTTKANDQVTQAAKSDLSIGDNIQSALHIFDPLYDGQTPLSQQIMGDHAVTTQAKSIQAQYQEAKTKNGGKEYSPINEQYSLQAYQDFVKKGDPNGWKTAYNSLKGFTPYYDYHKELTDNIKNCHGESTTQSGVNGMYIATSTTSGVDANRMAGCLGSNLSGNAERQIAIEGAVKYNGNYRGLADDYRPVAIQNKNVILTQKAELNTLLANPNITPQNKATIQQQIKGLDDQVSNIDNGINAIDKGDLSYIEQNYDDLSGAVYRGQKIASMAGAFSYVDTATKLQADPVQMMYARFKEDQSLLNQRENFDMNKMTQEYGLKKALEMWKIDYENKLKNGEITPVNPAVDPDAGPKRSQSVFEAQKLETQGKIDDMNRSLVSHLMSSPVTKGIFVGGPGVDPSVQASSIEGILKSSYILNQDPWLKDYKDQMDKLNLEKNTQLAKEQAINSSKPVVDARNRVANLVATITHGDNSYLSNKIDDPIQRGTNVPFSAQDIRDLLQQKGVRGMTLVKTVSKHPDSGRLGVPDTMENAIRMPDGRELLITSPYINDLISKRDGTLKDMSDVIDDEYNKAYVNTPTWGNLSAYNGPDAVNIRKRIQAVFSPYMSIQDDKNIHLTTTDYQGNVRFTVAPNSKGKFPDVSDMLVSARQNGFTDMKKVPHTDGTYELSGVNEFNRADDVKTDQMLQSFAEDLQRIAAESGNKFPRTPMFQNYHGFNISAVPGAGSGLVYELQDADNPSKIKYVTDPTMLGSYLKQIRQYSTR